MVGNTLKLGIKLAKDKYLIQEEGNTTKIYDMNT
jgi:hypothetical protein